jgi:hypothetical protein
VWTDLGWAAFGVGVLSTVGPSFSLLKGRHPERAALRGGPGHHKLTAAGSSVARSELWSRLRLGLNGMALGLALVTNFAFWARAVLFASATVGLALLAWRWRQNHLSKSNAL